MPSMASRCTSDTPRHTSGPPGQPWTRQLRRQMNRMQPCERPHRLPEMPAWTLLLYLCMFVQLLSAHKRRSQDCAYSSTITPTIVANIPNGPPSVVMCALVVRQICMLLSRQIQGRKAKMVALSRYLQILETESLGWRQWITSRSAQRGLRVGAGLQGQLLSQASQHQPRWAVVALMLPHHA